MKTISNIQKLISELSHSPKDNYKNLIENFEISRNELKLFENWSKDKYIRNGIYKDDNFEIILICWEKGQQTPVHCHGGEECWMCLLEGELEEVFYIKDENETLSKVKSHKMNFSKCFYINDTLGLHKLKNSFNGRSLSLHIYAKPILECSFYDDTQNAFVKKVLDYDTFNGEILNPNLETVS